ncbi:HWE histidine kinase domain-containing protein [Skermanella pratensis]|uniref:HWE histidine kinase domain-containing protein n=1 Tax=Skermanella pratensis TaxID=2233999 RepID=UPI001FEB8EBC|nr:HWE histidine kinase domain-containing protein [Skermanella pratensis]
MDLTNCDREPIGIPGSIQPHGFLVVLHPEALRILQAPGPIGTLPEVVLQRVDQMAKGREMSRRRQELQLAEPDHRVENTLANIQALVQDSASGHRGSSTAPEGFTASFGQRLRAMAYAHSLLTRSRWEGADLRSLLEEEARVLKLDWIERGGPAVTWSNLPDRGGPAKRQ